MFFFKQKTAYEMRISDWSSDVCSSDLDSDGLLQYLRSRFILHESAAACRNHLRLSVHQASDHPPLAIPEIRLPKALENISYAHACRQLDFFVSIDKRQAKPRSEPPSHSRLDRKSTRLNSSH